MSNKFETVGQPFSSEGESLWKPRGEIANLDRIEKVEGTDRLKSILVAQASHDIKVSPKAAKNKTPQSSPSQS